MKNPKNWSTKKDVSKFRKFSPINSTPLTVFIAPEAIEVNDLLQKIPFIISNGVNNPIIQTCIKHVLKNINEISVENLK